MDNVQIAGNILTQLGGNRFIAMTGAKNRSAIERGLQFNLPTRTAKNGINLVQITLDYTDTYTLAGIKWNSRKLEFVPVNSYSLVYAEDLGRLFTEMTGLDTHL